ncbi:MAG: HAD family phosphatase [Verrucomicrobiales bacterium]|nr:HAD family phosphatase [Verrucomicrobiae bacterium]
MIETIIFDLGGVLIDWDPRHLYRKLIPDEERMEYFLANICAHEWNEQHDAGHPVAEGMKELAAIHPDWEKEIFAYYERWPEMLGGPIEGTVDILSELHNAGEQRLLALTNWSAETFPVARERYDFLNWFENILVSGEEKMKKPDPRFFQLLFERFNVDPAKAVFIDDSARNIESAQNCGLHTIHFQSPEALSAELTRLL